VANRAKLAAPLNFPGSIRAVVVAQLFPGPVFDETRVENLGYQIPNFENPELFFKQTQDLCHNFMGIMAVNNPPKKGLGGWDLEGALLDSHTIIL